MITMIDLQILTQEGITLAGVPEPVEIYVNIQGFHKDLTSIEYDGIKMTYLKGITTYDANSPVYGCATPKADERLREYLVKLDNILSEAGVELFIYPNIRF